jgi:hypothetical protein
MHFISGKYESSSAVTNVPQDMHSYVTAPIFSLTFIFCFSAIYLLIKFLTSTKEFD